MRIAALALALVSQMAWAQVPNVIGYHGRLLKSDGTPATGAVSMVFTFYDAPTGGTSLWTETQTIALTDGFYATYLGSVTALPSGLFPGQDRDLEISVNGSSLQPRLRAGSVPHAISATQARNVTGGTVNAQNVSVGGVEVIDSTGKLVGPASAVIQVNVTSPLQSSGGTTPTLSVSGCAAGQVLKWSGTAWACASDDVGATGSFVSSVTAGSGITVTGTASDPVVSVNYGANNQLSPAGTVTAFLGDTPPLGWVMADGSDTSRTSCAGLFGVIGTTYGAGDGATTFGVPNLNDRRFLMGRSSVDPLGSVGGAFNHSHSVSSHNHGIPHSHSMAHTHSMQGHSHGMSHTHTTSAHVHGAGTLNAGTGSGFTGACAGGTAWGCSTHTHSITGSTGASSSGTSGPDVGNTAGPSVVDTGGSSSVNTGGSSALTSDLGGAGTSGTANPPFFAVNFIIKC